MGPNDRITSLLATASSDGGRIVSTVNTIIDILMAQQLAYTMHIPPPKVGIHPCNRDGYGVSATEVHALGGEIVSMGWSWQACSHAVCLEDDQAGTIAAFSKRIKNQSEGLADTTGGEVSFGSLSCSHTNQFLCCVLAEVESEVENLCIDNRMSQGKLTGQDKALGDALKKGLEWVVLKAEVATLYPNVPDLVQRARNGPGQAQRHENEIQVLLRIHRLARARSSKTDGDVCVDWPSVQKTLLQRKVSDPEDIPDLVRFVQRWGGGLEANFLQDLNDFHKVFVPSGRVVPGACPHALFQTFDTA